MSAEATEFVTSVPSKSIKTAIALVTGNLPNKADAALAVVNIQSYAYGTIFGDPTPPVMGATPPQAMSDTEAADALKQLDSPGMKAVPAGVLLSLLLTLAQKLLGL